jgi:hypothetical protein
MFLWGDAHRLKELSEHEPVSMSDVAMILETIDTLKAVAEKGGYSERAH